MNIDITKNSLDIAERFVRAFGRPAEGAIARSVNRSVMGIRTDGVKAVRKEYNVKAGIVRQAVVVRRASRGKLEASAVVSGNRISMIHFSPRPSSPGRRRPAAGVSVKIKRSRKAIAHSFIAKMRKSGSAGVFLRKGKARFPIVKKYSLAVPEMMGRDDILEEIQAGAVRRFDKTLDQEINHLMRKAGAR